jgi:hypothetical protein
MFLLASGARKPSLEIMMRRIVLLVAAVLAVAPLGALAQAPFDDAVVRKAAETITARDYYDRISVIAHDSMRGRDTPSPELDKTAEWIASEFRRFGLTPGGEDGTFLQRYAIRVMAMDLDGSRAWTNSGVELSWGGDLLPLFGLATPGLAQGAVVVVSGSGDVASIADSGRLEGKHVLMFPGSDGTSMRDRRWIRSLRAMGSSGALSVIVVGTESDEEWQRRVAIQSEAAQSVIGDGPQPGSLSILTMREAGAARMLAGSGLSVASLQDRAGQDPRLDTPEGLVLSLEPAHRLLQDTSAPNVIGILEGSDPELRDEYVIFSGHMDHVGVGAPDAEGDSIYNGADDDASGTIAVVEVAEAMASLPTPPRRSMLFLLVSGEEKGLWGSQHYVENPTVPLSDMVANLNMDMVGRNWPDTIVAIGKEHSDLGETLNRVNDRHPELNMTAIDDRWPEENFYRRSDHFNFARKGVPILFFFNGTHEDYHRPSDEVDKIDTDKAARISQLLFYLSLEVANADERPQWNPQSYSEIVSDRQ